MSTNPMLLEMLGGDLKTAVLAAQSKTGDDTVMVRVEVGVCIVSRGGADLQGGMSQAAAVAYLAALA